MASPKVIVFGASGNIGSLTALAAHRNNPQLEVVLALRDPHKPIPGLDPAHDKPSLNFTRVQADLTQPSTIRAAVAQTGATRAFVYLAPGQPDHMRATFTALKESGVDFVVFLSGLAVAGDDLAAIPPTDMIPWSHAQAEIALAEVFGSGGGGAGKGELNYVAVRPGTFASNLFHYKEMIAKGEVRVAYPEARGDYISPGDVGNVCGRLLARGKEGVEEGRRSIVLCGPRRISQEEAVRVVGRVIGKEVEVGGFEDEEEAVKACAESMHLPEFMARELVRTMREIDGMFARVDYEEAVANVEKYGGKPATKFEDWVEANKGRFLN